MQIDDFASEFSEEPGYLDFAKVGPLSRAVVEEEQAQVELLRKARFGSLDALSRQDLRVREAVAAVTGLPLEGISFQPDTSTGLMHAMFGITGGTLLSPAEFPSVTVAASRAAEALGVLRPVWLQADYGRVMPGTVKEQLTDDVVAVAVSLVDYHTGYLADLEGIRQVIGDRLLLVDAAQGFTVVDAPYHLADIVVSGGQKWARAGWSTGFMSLSERALDQLTPVLSGYRATDEDPAPDAAVPPPARGVAAFQTGHPSPIAQARLAAALEEIAEVGVSAISERVLEQSDRLIELADEFAIPVVSPRERTERAGIVVLEPAADQFTVLVASLYNQGVSVTTQRGTVRLSAHVTTSDETFDMLRASFTAFSSTVTV